MDADAMVPKELTDYITTLRSEIGTLRDIKVVLLAACRKSLQCLETEDWAIITTAQLKNAIAYAEAFAERKST